MASRLSYGDDPSQYGVLYGEGPVAVVIHGGFWKAEYDLELMTALCEDLAERGFSAWNIEYRRLGNGGGVPNTLDDVAELEKAAAQREVLFVKGTDFLLEGGQNTLRLAYSGVTPEQIDEGITKLAEAVRSLGAAVS